MGNRSIKTMAQAKKKVVNPLAAITAGVVKVAGEIINIAKSALPYKEKWEETCKGRSPEEVKEMVTIIVADAEKVMGIVKGDDSPECACKRAALSRSLREIGIERRKSAPKGEPIDEKKILSVLALVAKLEKEDARQRKLVRACYDRLLKPIKK